jgi:hypothetical protein
MSLHIYLKKKLSLCPTCGQKHDSLPHEELFTANITHNLIGMAEQAGLYQPIWNPEEYDYGVKSAKDLIVPLTEGLERLLNEPRLFKELNPLNGWGTYETLTRTAMQYLAACVKYPDAIVEVDK